MLAVMGGRWCWVIRRGGFRSSKQVGRATLHFWTNCFTLGVKLHQSEAKVATDPARICGCQSVSPGRACRRCAMAGEYLLRAAFRNGQGRRQIAGANWAGVAAHKRGRAATFEGNAKSFVIIAYRKFASSLKAPALPVLPPLLARKHVQSCEKGVRIYYGIMIVITSIQQAAYINFMLLHNILG